MSGYFTAIYRGEFSAVGKASDFDRNGFACVGVAAGNDHAERWKLHKALTELVAAIDKRWADEPERKRANAISPRMEDALAAARAVLEQ